ELKILSKLELKSGFLLILLFLKRLKMQAGKYFRYSWKHFPACFFYTITKLTFQTTKIQDLYRLDFLAIQLKDIQNEI
ncbi:MAG: hypothetical protein WAO52_11050, partial [Prolixibacteraceae bacterium]